LAGFDVEKRHAEKHRGEEQHRQILHCRDLVFHAGCVSPERPSHHDPTVDIQMARIESAEGKPKEKIKMDFRQKPEAGSEGTRDRSV
jgi:hypothetical protein